jgi:hypothetical protein
MLRLVWAPALACGLSAFSAVSAAAGEYQCRRDDSAVRIAVEVEKPGHTLPCEVIAEDDRGERALLYSAQYDRDYCPDRLEKTRSDLEDKGWACQKTSDINIVEGTGLLRPADEIEAEDVLAEEVPAEESRPARGPGDVIIADARSCRRGDSLRRLRIEVEDPKSGKPCSLVYWSEDDRSETGEQLWRAEHDAEFCPKRLGFIVQKWIGEGWRCNAADDVAVQSAAVAAPETPETEAPPAAEPVPVVAAVETSEPEAPNAAAPVEPDPAPAATIPSATAIEKALPAAGGVDPKLQAVIEADAERIGAWMEVEPNIQIAGRGDLNADGRDDAVVFLAYQSEQSVYRQYLMSYLAGDDAYQLAGVKLLTGVSPPPAQAKVEQIDDGIIWLNLADETGTRRQQSIGYVLRDQQLVEIDTPEHAKSTSN